MLVAPSRKHQAFTLGPNIGSGNLNDIRDAKRPQLTNLPRGRILVTKPPADELTVFYARRVDKNRNARRDASLHEVRRFERPRATGIRRYDDDVRGRERFVHDERPCCGSQSRFLNGGNGNEGSRGQCDYHEDRGPPRPPIASCVHLQKYRRSKPLFGNARSRLPHDLRGARPRGCPILHSTLSATASQGGA